MHTRHLIKFHEHEAGHQARMAELHRAHGASLDDGDPHKFHLLEKAAAHDECASFHRKAAGGLRAELPEREYVPRGHAPREDEKAAEFSSLLKTADGDADRAIRSPDPQLRIMLGVE